ncbi:MAG: DUF370 domain-containing protein [Clostridia bacterium]|nr:DUF370 domain-containing protein [Clostridia bacterium]
MYIHIGCGNVLRKSKIIGIFDLDTATVTPASKVFLRRAERGNDLVNCSEDIPKAFIVDEHNRVYISQLSTRSLRARAEAKGFR